MTAIMFQGTGSDVGKSLIVAGLCRAFARRGIKALPFKPQNMSNNAAVVDGGGEIGRAQWLQAFAAGVAPSVHMNPVLLKPQSDRTSQVVVQGRVHATASAVEYQSLRKQLVDAVMESYAHIRAQADIVLVEGAGSPAEINLRDGDLANMGFAARAQCPVVLVGDIDRGGVIASVAGTHAVLPAPDRAMVAGFIINKFRGDVSLFDEGVAAIRRHTSWPCFGVVPYFADLRHLPQEDALSLPRGTAIGAINIVALAFPHLANFDDLDPLIQAPGVSLRWLKGGEALPADTHLVILPGSKATTADMEYLRAQGWDTDLKAHVRRGGRVMGLCGGYQMLGRTIRDHGRREGGSEVVEGLGLLDVETVFAPEKTVTPWQGQSVAGGIDVTGYEIHLGVTTGGDTVRPLFQSARGNDGATSKDGLVSGTYIHGIFANDDYRHALLSTFGARNDGDRYWPRMDDILNRWADVLEASLDMDALMNTATPHRWSKAAS